MSRMIAYSPFSVEAITTLNFEKVNKSGRTSIFMQPRLRGPLMTSNPSANWMTAPFGVSPPFNEGDERRQLQVTVVDPSLMAMLTALDEAVAASGAEERWTGKKNGKHCPILRTLDDGTVVASMKVNLAEGPKGTEFSIITDTETGKVETPGTVSDIHPGDRVYAVVDVWGGWTHTGKYGVTLNVKKLFIENCAAVVVDEPDVDLGFSMSVC